jgi:hypothetical protein
MSKFLQLGVNWQMLLRLQEAPRPSCSCCSARSPSSCTRRPLSISRPTVCTWTQRTPPPPTPSTYTTRATSSTTVLKTCSSHRVPPSLTLPRSRDSKVGSSRWKYFGQSTQTTRSARTDILWFYPARSEEHLACLGPNPKLMFRYVTLPKPEFLLSQP